MTGKTQITIAALVVATVGGGLWVHKRAEASATPSYRLGKIERASVKSTVSATGALGAVRTVEVGTQVSGQISAMYVDYNTQVKKGQLIARIDPTLQQQAVQDAQAGVARAQAPMTQTKLEYDRQKTLHEQKIVTDAEWNTAISNFEVAKANLTSAQISLDKARQNLSYTNIYSPIDGVVVERAMDVGQTVAASLSAPKLFVIANNLSEMQILASVDESDIGKIVPGQNVSFTVQSYPARAFDGTVNQVRLNSTTVNNVVSYTAVVRVANNDNKLLPGMTATVKFVTATADSVLTVPVAALRFTPANVKDTVTATRTPNAAGAAQAGGPPAGGPGAGGFGGGPGGGFPGGAGGARPNRGTMTRGALWTIDAAGVLTKHPVITGLTDGTKTQVMGKDIKEGESIVIGTNVAGVTAATPAATNPLQQNQQRGRGGPPGGF